VGCKRDQYEYYFSKPVKFVKGSFATASVGAVGPAHNAMLSDMRAQRLAPESYHPQYSCFFKAFFKLIF
jgi:hypothetical protein